MVMAGYFALAWNYFGEWARAWPWVLLTVWLVEVVLLAVGLWAVSFFRDPKRECPQDKRLLLAPADGRVTDIETVDHDIIGGKALKIGIFLSIFDVHINRAPCSVRVERTTYRKGRYRNAMNPESGRVNESNNLEMVRVEEPRDRLLVRQISGAIARRIVCSASTGTELKAAERFGMIKYGSRTELYVPARDEVQCLVQIGDRVKAGLTPLARYAEPGGAEQGDPGED
mgnify:FL=1